MITYQVELLKNCLEELKPLLVEHYGEIALNQDKIDFNPDYDRYLQLEELGVTHTVTVRDGGNIVGYYISFVSPHMHYQDHLYAMNDIMYVDPSCRGGTIAFKMMKFAEKELKDIGVSVMMLHMKTAHRFDRLCEAVGMSRVEVNYAKYIGD